MLICQYLVAVIDKKKPVSLATLLLLWKQEPLLGEKAEKRLQVLFKDFMRKQDFALLQGVPGSRVVAGVDQEL